MGEIVEPQVYTLTKNYQKMTKIFVQSMDFALLPCNQCMENVNYLDSM